MISITDKIIYATYSVIVSLLMLLCSKYGYRSDPTIGKCKASIWVRFPSVLYDFSLILVVVFFCAFRKIDVGIGGTDANAYRLQFLSSTGSLVEQLIRFRGWEPIHALSMWLVRAFTDKYRVYLVLYYIALSLILVKISHMYAFRRGSFLTLLSIALFSLESFNTQRNVFAAFMGFLIVGHLKEKKLGKALITALVAFLIHFSAAIYFVVIFGFYYINFVRGKYERKLTFYVIFSMGLSALISRLIPLVVAGTRLSVYSTGLNISAPMVLAFIFIVIFQCVRGKKLSKDIDTTILFTMFVAFAPMFIFQLFYPIMYRMMLFSIPIMYVLIWKYKTTLIGKIDLYSISYYFLFNALLFFRMLPLFTEEFSDIGKYVSTLI